MGWKPFRIGLLVGLAGATLVVGLYSCGVAVVPTAPPPPRTTTPAPPPTAPPPTATAVPTVAGIDLPRPTYAATPPALPARTGLEITATALGVVRDTARRATAVAGCAAIETLYAGHGRSFDRAAAARDVGLATLDLHLTLFGTAAPATGQQGQAAEALYRGYLLDCLGAR